MADHPAIVALARLFNPHAWACEGLKIDDCDTKSDRHDTLEQARAAYAAVLRDLIASSGDIILGDEIDNVMSELYGDKRKHPLDEWMIGMIRARAREIGVEVE